MFRRVDDLENSEALPSINPAGSLEFKLASVVVPMTETFIVRDAGLTLPPLLSEPLKCTAKVACAAARSGICQGRNFDQCA